MIPLFSPFRRRSLDPNYANVSCLFHMDGSNGGTSFPDNGPGSHTGSASGDAVTSTTQAKFGTASFNSPGGAGFVGITGGSSPFAFPGLFTIEAWVYWNGAGHSDVFATGTDTSLGLAFYIRNTGGVSVTKGASSLLIGTTALVSANTWTHVAVTRDGSNIIRVFAGGVLDATTATDGFSVNATAGAQFGTNTLGAGITRGFIDELRVTKDVCRYTTTFTPPTQPFPNSP